MEQSDEFQGIQVSYYVNPEYLYRGSIFKAIDPTSYSGYEAHMYIDED